MSIFFLCPHRVEGTKEFSGVSKSTDPFMRLYPYNLITQRYHSLIPLGVRISTYGFGEDTNIQHVASRVLEAGFPEAPEKTMHLSLSLPPREYSLGFKDLHCSSSSFILHLPLLDQEFIPVSGNKSNLV